jgi:sugar phosphate isomerase/epimerase
MKLAFSTNAFKRYSLEDAIRIISDLNYEGVEIMCDIPHAYPKDVNREKIKVIHDLTTNLGIQISNLNAFTMYAISDVYHPSWIESDEKQRRLRIEHTIECIKLAKHLGAKNISTEPGGPLQNNMSRLDAEKIFLKGLEEVAAVAEELEIKVLVEPEPGLLMENSRQFLKFIQQISSGMIRLNFDIGHFYCVREDPAKLVYELADYIEHFHLADISHDRVHNHLIPGSGSIDFESTFKSIREIGFNGFVTVELYPYQDNPTYAAKAAYEHLISIAA